MAAGNHGGKLVRWLNEFSIPLIAGVACALILANVAPELYHSIVWTPLTEWGHAAATDGHQLGHGEGWGHYFTLHFLINDLFMVLFFGVATKEITEACLPNGALNPVKKAVNPLLATLGGILGPVAVFLGLNAIVGHPEWVHGWGITTATDIALAWLVAKLIFGAGHPAISFLLLLAVADDAIGLGIIAIAYPDPLHPTVWTNLLWIVPGMVTAFSLRKLEVQSWLPYIFIGGAFCWWGLHSAHLHPALALVFIVPFLPGPGFDLGLYTETQQNDHEKFQHATHSPLENFEHDLRLFVDCGLFFFALANAGVSFSGMSSLTWIVVAALVVGKLLGITLCSSAANLVGFPLPKGMYFRHLVVIGVIAGLGLTVALFVSGQAFTETATQDAAKMGALFSAGVGGLAFALAWSLGIVRPDLGRIRRTWDTAVLGRPVALESERS